MSLWGTPSKSIGAKITRALFAALPAILLWLSPASGQNADAAAPGKEVAMKHCADCHAIDPGTESPHAAAPPFSTFAADFPLSMLEDALTSGIVGGHDEMPMFDLGFAEARALLAYLDSLSPPSRRYLER